MSVYVACSCVLDDLYSHKGSLKSLVLRNDYADKKRLYGLVCETLKYRTVIDHIIDASQILCNEKKLSRTLLQALIHDFLFGKKGITIPITHRFNKIILSYKTRLNAELQIYKVKHDIKSNACLSAVNGVNDKIPRYVRINTLKISVNNAIHALEKFGYKEGDISKAKRFQRDKHLDELLAFHPKTDFHENELYLNGSLILQDKASCFPAVVLSPPLNSKVIDACAAPGNKTSHLSALMQNTGKIFAFDLDKNRLETLRKLTSKAGCENISAIHGSFLEVNPEDPLYKDVEYFLLDPSCSGSGIVSRLDYLVDTEDDMRSSERLTKLADFQLSIILHAFKFPNAKKIIYSTCSVNVEENEEVVVKAVASSRDFSLAHPSNVLPQWTRRGVSLLSDTCQHEWTSEMANSVLRCDPRQETSGDPDLTNGFFVACFIRNSCEKRKMSSPNADTHKKPRLDDAQRIRRREKKKRQKARKRT